MCVRVFIGVCIVVCMCVCSVYGHIGVCVCVCVCIGVNFDVRGERGGMISGCVFMCVTLLDI